MAYIVVGIAIWVAAGIAVALLLGKAIKLADMREGHDRFVGPGGRFNSTVSGL